MYVLDYNRQNLLIREMTQLRKDSENWVVYYHHPSTNEMWKSFFPKANEKSRGPKVLRIEPVSEKLQERLDTCLQSDIEEDATGLGIELSVDPGKWERIMGLIEEQYKTYNRNQLKLFFRAAGLEDPASLFDELGLGPADFGMSDEQVENLVSRARKVRFKRFWYFF